MMGLLSLVEGLSHVALRARGLRGRMIDTAVGRVHAYVGRGHGALPPVVMVHGIGSAAAPFAPVIARVQEHVRAVIAPELPGHGWSAPPRGRLAPDTLFEVMGAVIDRLIDEPAVVVGNSLGGAVALDYARTRPEKVRALVLLSPAGARMSEDELEAVRRVFHLRSTADAIAFVERVYHRAPPGASWVAGDVRRQMGRAVVRELLANVRSDHGFDPDALRGLTMPVTLMWGRSERVLPASGLAYFRAHLPAHARVEEPEGVGHCPHLDRPGLVARRIVEAAISGSALEGARAHAGDPRA
ncbi:putative hydrolase [Sandaracinus amylolyticus]|uniref:Putative hydrolase n=2 Tax=Sandaracinus amylolyticus TaxID=927083 RepID=A0A0F6YNJ3_9BACT|nr:putative hydrolase [Sandaracinus amylolyticus]